MDGLADQGDGHALRHRLAQPVRQSPLSAAAQDWHHVRIHIRCQGGADMVADPRTAARFRGALGRRLAEAASPEARAGAPCPWTPPCALDWLFGKHGRISGGLEIPKPYVIATAAADGDMVVSLTLFGFAGDLAEAIAEAMIRALRSGLNDGSVERVHYRPLEIRSRTLSVFDGVPVMVPPPGAVLAVTLRTPLSIREGDRIKAVDFGDLVSAATHRVQGMARWQDTALHADWPELIAEGRTLANHTANPPRIGQWRRGSTRQNRHFTVGGSLGQWLVDTPSPDLLTLLTLAATTGAGGRTTLGMGQFDIRLYAA